MLSDWEMTSKVPNPKFVICLKSVHFKIELRNLQLTQFYSYFEGVKSVYFKIKIRNPQLTEFYSHFQHQLTTKQSQLDNWKI